jgi:pimeloyl-ACP methyl ester carboxylesterase
LRRSAAVLPLVRVGHWLSHLEHDWHSPIWRPFLSELGKSFTVVRYDQRGNGLSDRDVDDLSLEAFVSDLETVIDAAGLDRFAIYASSQGVPVALEYAARHPARLNCLALHGGFVKGRLLRSQAEREQGEAYLALMRHGWGAEGSQFLQAFGSIYVPDGTPEQLRSLVELQRISATAETAVRLREAFDRFDVTHRLSAIEVPTLVLHGRNDGVHPLQQSLEMTAALPDAELVVLETRNHIMVGHDPAWPEFFAALRRFVLAHAPAPLAQERGEVGRGLIGPSPETTRHPDQPRPAGRADLSFCRRGAQAVVYHVPIISRDHSSLLEGTWPVAVHGGSPRSSSSPDWRRARARSSIPEAWCRRRLTARSIRARWARPSSCRRSASAMAARSPIPGGCARWPGSNSRTARRSTAAWLRRSTTG